MSEEIVNTVITNMLEGWTFVGKEKKRYDSSWTIRYASTIRRYDGYEITGYGGCFEEALLNAIFHAKHKDDQEKHAKATAEFHSHDEIDCPMCGSKADEQYSHDCGRSFLTCQNKDCCMGIFDEATAYVIKSITK